MTKGPSIKVEDGRKLVMCSEVMDQDMGMALGRESTPELEDGGKVAEEESERWLWLIHVNRV